MTTGAARALLGELVDYAGLFPPAGLEMEAAVRQYAGHRAEPEAWMLGRFVVPAARLDELERATGLTGGGESLVTPDGPWTLSALVGPAFENHAHAVRSFNERHVARARIDAVEFRATSRAELEAALDVLPAGLTAYVELPLDDADGGSLDELLPEVESRGARAKVRTGGVTPDLIPGTAPLARFVTSCVSAGVAFKATAGLHHPIRSEHPLTYEDGAPVATMHGFLNVFGAAALALDGLGPAQVEDALRESAESAFRLDGDGLSLGPHRATTDLLARARTTLATSFGSCSFAEPVADLKSLGVIP